MCNLYSVTKTQEAMRRLFNIQHDRAGKPSNAAGYLPRPARAPGVCNAKNGERSLELMRWGFPPPPNLSTRPCSFHAAFLRQPFGIGED